MSTLTGKCSYFREDYQHHPYGSTTAAEDISECTNQDISEEDWERYFMHDKCTPDCPGYEERPDH